MEANPLAVGKEGKKSYFSCDIIGIYHKKKLKEKRTMHFRKYVRKTETTCHFQTNQQHSLPNIIITTIIILSKKNIQKLSIKEQNCQK